MRVIDVAEFVRRTIDHDYYLIAGIAIAIFILFGFFHGIRYMALIYGTMSVAWLLKIIFDEPRPNNEFALNSFPSGSTMMVMVLMLYIFMLIVKHVKCKPELKVAIGSFLFLLVALMSYQRIYFGHHYLRDIVFGITIAIGVFMFLFWLFDLVHNKWLTKWKVWLFFDRFKGLVPIVKKKVLSKSKLEETGQVNGE